jgi:hypothetical protein
MSLSKVYCNLLSPFVEKYKEAKNANEKTKIIKNAADAVSNNKDALEDQGVDLPKDLRRVSTYLPSFVSF